VLPASAAGAGADDRGWPPVLQGADSSATDGGRRCFKDPTAVQPTTCSGASRSRRRCYRQRPLVLEPTTEGGRQFFKELTALLPTAAADAARSRRRSSRRGRGAARSGGGEV
jgi:hypothetical protein